MKPRRYALLILDSTGRPTRRLTLLRHQLTAALTALALTTTMIVLGTAHGLARLSDAHEAGRMDEENAQLRALVTNIESRLPSAQALAVRATLGFDQLKAKSNLGADEHLPGMGPTEPSPDEPANQQSRVPSSDVLRADPRTLPLELDRLQQTGDSVLLAIEDTVEYLHDAERLLSNTPSIKPVRHAWLTSSFGRRADPLDRSQVLMHKGLDLGGYSGADIFAPADGVVIFCGHRGGYGTTVVVDHGFGIQTHYAHLSRIKVQPGEQVRRGQIIALMGNTGKSTGPHLHYEVRRLGKPLDPQRFILD